MQFFESYIPISVLYPRTSFLVMSDPLAPFLLNLPEVTWNTIQNADDATQAGLATNYSTAERQVKFSVQQAEEIVCSLIPALVFVDLTLTIARC